MAETTDVLVIGAGVFGLWAARAAASAGLRVIVAEASAPGAGSSGGLVGALTPHLPTRWRPFKAFQMRGLETLGARLAELAGETGIDAGHARCGRITPIADAAARGRALAQAAAAHDAWGGRATFEVLDAPPGEADGLLDPAAAPFGVIRDTLSGRVEPRGVIAALAASVAARAELRTGWRLAGLDPRRMVARFDRGEIAAGHVVAAAGWRSLGLLPAGCLPPGALSGAGVKGQAALLAARAEAGAPLVQAGGLFIVPHASGGIAVGSTTEKTWEDERPDAALDAVIAEARRLAPALRAAPILERWSGIRPRAPGREPLAGPLPGAPRLLLATGGYKIGFSVAHLVGDALAAIATGADSPDPLPASFSPEAHGLRADV